jgi:hypothetical protein
MAELFPALTHLQPPYIRCTQVRLHRFSPLFVERDRVGLKDVVPTPAHHELYPFPPAVVSKLAYYFDHSFVSHPEPNSYIGKLAAAVERWHAEVGQATFFSLARGETLRLVDTRAVASAERAVLEGFERAVFDGCQHGASAATLARSLDTREDDVLRVLDRFVERRWVTYLDGQYLSLAVPMDRHAPGAAGLPIAIVERTLREGCQRVMARIHQGDDQAPSAAAYRRIHAIACAGTRPRQ